MFECGSGYSQPLKGYTAATYTMLCFRRLLNEGTLLYSLTFFSDFLLYQSRTGEDGVKLLRLTMCLINFLGQTTRGGTPA